MSSGKLRCVVLVRTDVSEEGITSIIMVTSVLRLLLTANVVLSSPILVALMTEAIRSSGTSVLTRAIRCIIIECILHCHRCKNLKS
jgi:hypothetical protein